MPGGVPPPGIASGGARGVGSAAMGQPAPTETGGDHRVTVERYFGLVDEGVLDADDRVELLDGVIVAMAPQRPGHAGTIDRVARALRRAVRSEEHTSELQSRGHLVCRLLLEKK